MVVPVNCGGQQADDNGGRQEDQDRQTGAGRDLCGVWNCARRALELQRPHDFVNGV